MFKTSVWFDFNQVASVSYDPSGMAQNGVTTQHMLPTALTQYGRHYGAQTMQSYSLPGNPWLPQYVMPPAPHMTQVEVSNITKREYDLHLYVDRLPHFRYILPWLDLGDTFSKVTEVVTNKHF